MSFRSEHSANLSLSERTAQEHSKRNTLSLIPTKRPAWTNPSTCVRTRPAFLQRLLRLIRG